MSDRALGGIGMASFALIVVAGLVEPLWNVPGTESSGARVLAYVTAHREGFLAALTTYALGMGLFLAFTAGVWSRLRRDGAPEPPAAMFLVGSVSLTTLVFAGFVPMLVLAYRTSALEPSSATILYDLSFGLLAISGVPTAVALAAFAFIVARTRALPAITGWTAAVAAVAHVVIAGSFLPSSGFFSLEGGVIVAIPITLFAWLAVTSAALVTASGPRHGPARRSRAGPGRAGRGDDALR